ncbi:MAG: U3 snoRNP protein [Pleopsidium flavum]|nr:MAG: U3 snoRNP protein [Pleopsidium flavum]
MTPQIALTPTTPAFSGNMSHPPAADLHPASEDALLSTLSASPHTFLQPPPSLHFASLALAKRYLDPLASTISELQSQRQQDTRRKRKRGDEGAHGYQQVLQLNQLYLDGFDIEQVWEQARRVLDASREEVERDLPSVLSDGNEAAAPGVPARGPHDKEKELKMLKFDEDGFEVSGPEDEEEDHDPEGLLDDQVSSESHQEERMDNVMTDVMADEEGTAALEEEEDIEAEELDVEGEGSLIEEPIETFVSDPNGLNDGFFSIDDFNRQSEFLEQQDTHGDPNDVAASDDEDIDWDADPMTIPSFTKGLVADGNDEGDNTEGEDGDGPTFGDTDLNALSSDDEEDIEDLGAMDNTNDIKYDDFFAPPPRKATKPNRKRALPKTQPSATSNIQEDPEDIQRTISAVRRDLFDDNLSANADSEPPSDVDPGDPKSRKSNHERRQAKLAEEIRHLEAANVAKREWTLSGEARAADRPMNSLLEEDLDFERAGKPVPVITNEVSEDIEALIKRRILAKEFDEVIRRRPDSLTNGPNVRRGRFELDNTKPQQSLAEMYEADHLKAIDPSGYVDKRDEKLKKEHAEIEILWKDICAKLDALSNWHYKPKPPQPSISVVADMPTISMEDARPTASGDVGGVSMLAPQEVYKPGDEKSKEDVVLKSGVPVAREEMSREEKLRRRRREKERIKKAGGLVGKGKDSKKAKEKIQVASDLKKGGVKIIGKKGEVKDVEGKSVKVQKAHKGADGFKL